MIINKVQVTSSLEIELIRSNGNLHINFSRIYEL